MSDERGRGAEDDGRPRDPDAEVGAESDDWLLQQLTGGRRIERRAEVPDAPGAVPAEEQPAEEEPAASVDPGLPDTSGESSPHEPAAFDELLTSDADEPAAAEEPVTEFPVAFSWNLKPGEGGDPLVREEPASAAEKTPTLFEPVAPDAPSTQDASEESEVVAPPVHRSNYVEPKTGPAETVPFVGAAAPTPEAEESRAVEPEPDEPEPDEPEQEAPAPVRSWVIEPALPTPPAPVEEPRTIFDAPPAADATADDDSDESHGLAALLGFGAPDTDEPSGRSIIGDTTSVIPLDPSFVMPPPKPETPAAEPEVPPTEPQAPPTRVEDTPTQQLDAAELAALLRAEPDEPQVVLPSEPAIPAAEAEVALGGMPSPATSTIDAASIAAASEPVPYEPVPSEPDEEQSEPGEEQSEPDADPLADLFGGPDEPEEDHSAPVDPFEDKPEPEPAAGVEGPQLPATAPFIAPVDTRDDLRRRSGGAPSDEAAGVAAIPATSTGVPAGPTGPTTPGLWGSRNNRILFTVAGALAVILVLIGLFALGTRIPSWFGAAAPAAQPFASTTPTPKATPTPTPTPVPTVTPKPAAAVGPGTHPWDTLGGGECIQPFTSVWAEDFTVVDCTTPHTAQLVYTNLLSADPAAAYPGADALAQQIPGLCTAGGVVDLGAAGAYPDLQVVGSFPATEQQWKDGQRSYYCFATRSSGQPLTTSVAGPGPTA
ncbi:hypothetical protein [Leifsonia sp. fls2-241-R2A-40a]|uniref:hypothetical protein n=1 Tax=Leifsonia sp. fls2-241-R2A-40a TaxID=3040290 RepID=UPI00254F021C|nr:hypothetical protein [Leifsonia sp. fls2-241-R2A-40a]